MTDFTLSDGRRIHLIGDPHLGKNFDNHCPPHRRGERAVHQMAQFNQELAHQPADMVIMVGDLFDHPQVSHATIVAAARATLFWAETYSDCVYIMMAGNHDMPRNISAVGAWTTFTKMLEDRLPNLLIARRPMVVHDVALFPWEWDRTAAEQVGDVAGLHAEAAVGHWDLKLFDGDGDHMAPVKELMSAFGSNIDLYSGHFHTPGLYNVEGVNVVCTGSMQPISHGEDPDEKFYVTRSLDAVLADPEAYRDKHVRVLVKPGDEVPDLDCLGVTHVRVREDDENHEVSLSPANFDWTKRLADRIKSLTPQVRAFIIERMPDADPEKQRGSGAGDSAEGPRNGPSSDDEVQPDSPLR